MADYPRVNISLMDPGLFNISSIRNRKCFNAKLKMSFIFKRFEMNWMWDFSLKYEEYVKLIALYVFSGGQKLNQYPMHTQNTHYTIHWYITHNP